MAFANYVRLAPGIPTRMHFSDDYIVDRWIREPESGRDKRILGTLIFYVDELEGAPASRSFSILSAKLRATFEPYLPERRYRGYDVIITQQGEGFLKDWNVQFIKRPDEG